MEDSTGSRVGVVSTQLTAITFTIFEPVMWGYLFIVRAVDTIRETELFKPFKTGVIIWEIRLKVFDGVLHCLHTYSVHPCLRAVKG